MPYQYKMMRTTLLITFVIFLLISCDRCPSYYRNVGTNTFRMLYACNSLEVYMADFGAYPLPDTKIIRDEYISIAPSDILISHGKVQVGESSFKDSFTKRCEPYRYYSNGKDYILICAGPDMEYENLEVYENVLNDDSSTSQSFIHTIYDPTNGVFSKGNIIFTSRRLGIHIDIPTHELPYTRKK